MKKFTILAGLMALALFIGVAGTSLRADKAEARPTDVISFSPGVCVFLASAVDWDVAVSPVDFNGDGDIGASDNATFVCVTIPMVSGGLTNPANLAALADALGGDVDDPDTYAALVDA